MTDDTSDSTDTELSLVEEPNDEIVLPKFRTMHISGLYNYEENVVDFATLEDYNEKLNVARVALFKLTDLINEYDRREKAAKINYDRAHRRAYLESNERTESAKKARADLKCEGLENTYLVYQQVKEDLQRTSFTMRQELQALQTVGNNLRQQLKIN